MSFLFSTKPLRIIFCSNDLSAGEIWGSSFSSLSSVSPVPAAAVSVAAGAGGVVAGTAVPVFGLPFGTGSLLHIVIPSTYDK